jgi:Uma2 family endonuclease
MIHPASRARYSYEEYRCFEEATDAKHEYADGEILAMAGGTPEHAALAAAVIAEFSRHLTGGPCSMFSSDLRVRIRATGLATYPDVTVVCGDLQRDVDDAHAAVNPTVLVEVLSDSTEAYDRGDKFTHYQLIPELRAYVLVSHRDRHVEVWSRDPAGAWQHCDGTRGMSVAIEPIGLSISVDAIYDRAPVTRGI